jgi:hypothetical protein
MVTNISIFTFFATIKTFDITKDLLETNILNLSIVIVTLIYYGNIAFAALINN